MILAPGHLSRMVRGSISSRLKPKIRCRPVVRPLTVALSMVTVHWMEPDLAPEDNRTVSAPSTCTTLYVDEDEHSSRLTSNVGWHDRSVHWHATLPCGGAPALAFSPAPGRSPLPWLGSMIPLKQRPSAPRPHPRPPRSLFG